MYVFWPLQLNDVKEWKNIINNFLLFRIHRKNMAALFKAYPFFNDKDPFFKLDSSMAFLVTSA